MQQVSDTTQITDTLQSNNAHDYLIQMLSTLMVQINALQALTHADTPNMPAIQSHLTDLEHMAREIINELRSSSDDMSLSQLVGVTLVEALSRLVEETAETAGLSSRVVFSGEDHPLSSYTERLLYRIAQEALYQVPQHAGVRKLRFTLNYGRDDVQMGIEDDGLQPNLPIPLNEDTPERASEDVPIPHFQSASSTNTVLDALRHRIEHLDGSLEITTQPEQGTRVQVRIPYADTSPPERVPQLATPATPATPTTSSPDVPATERVSVLVVDSQSVTRAGLRHLLESYGDIQVKGEAADGVQAVSEALELGPQVVLMDTQLPNGQSMEALRQIKQLNLETRVLLLSTSDREDYLYETLRAGADGYILKDIAPDELAQAIRAVARGEVSVQPELAGRLLSRVGRQGRGNAYEELTTREQEVLQLLARGLRNKEIAARLYVSERTINFHLQNIYQKLQVSGRTEALSKAIEHGLLRT